MCIYICIHVYVYVCVYIYIYIFACFPNQLSQTSHLNFET